MASHAPKSSRKSIEDMMRDLKVDPLAKITGSSTVTGTVSAKERTQSDTRSRVSSAGDVKGSVVGGETDYESFEIYQGLPCPFGGYYGFYYPGLDGSVGETKDQGYYCNGAELQYPIMQGENGSLIYFMPGFHPYDASNTYLPVNPIGVDAQYPSQTLHSSAPMFAAHGYLQNAFSYGDLMSPAYLWDPSLLTGDSVFANTPGLIQNISSSSHDHGHHPKNKTSFSSLNAFSGHGIGDQFKTSSKASQHSTARQPDIWGKAYFPFTTFPLYNQGGRMFYPTDSVGKKAGASNWVTAEKVKARSKVNGISISDFANDQDLLPDGGSGPCSLAIDGNGKSNGVATVIKRDQYNLPNFQTKYDHAFFFVIKSYSEDDIHKSIKYSVWSSTTNGNKKLENAYQEAQKRIAEQGGKWPVFLFFSVNASGQFCGVAEMTGRVDFEESMGFWQQDKWTGYFPVKWHIVKDVPNPHLRHIILENNESKPVTNSRDTQEVRLPQGNEMLNIFKNYASKTSILDDFDFYESREKVMLQKKLRSPVPNFAQIKKGDNLVAGHQTMNMSTAESVEPGEGNKDRD